MFSDLASTAIAAARAGAEVLERLFRDTDLEVRRKGDHDFVTAADHGSEAAVIAAIRQRFPEHRVLAEESGAGGGKDGAGGDDYEWVIDPLDGTTNYLQGLPIWCVSVACRRGAELLAGAVLDPQGGNLFVAERGAGAFWNDRRMAVSTRPGLEGAFLATGYPFRAHAALELYLDVFREVFHSARAIRRCGAAALDLSYVAAGVYDGFFEFRLSPWDVAAGALLIAEAGGAISDLDGGAGYLVGGNVLAGNPGVQRELRERVGRHADEATLDRLVPLARPNAGAGGEGPGAGAGTHVAYSIARKC